jgi:putative PIN family toxin of toxin-antitoxin system
VQAVLDPNVVISVLLSPTGSPAAVLRAWEQGRFELVTSSALLEELARALAYPKLRRRIAEQDAEEVLSWLSGSATVAADPGTDPPIRSPDPGDDYLIALAAASTAALASGDQHLLGLSAKIPVFSPGRFLALLGSG